MKHRDRVLTALDHEATDRCPMQISFTPEFAVRLRADMKLTDQRGDCPNFRVGDCPNFRGHRRAAVVDENGTVPLGGETTSAQKAHNPHGGGNTYDLERALDEDLLLTSVGWANCYYQSHEPYTDEWGVGWRPSQYTTPFGKGFYTEITGHPLADAEAISTYRPPDPNRPELYEDAAHLIRTYGREYFIVGVTVTTIFETAWALRGLETLLMDLVTDPDLAQAILDIPYRYHLTAAKKLVEMGVDAIWVGDDVGRRKGWPSRRRCGAEFSSRCGPHISVS